MGSNSTTGRVWRPPFGVSISTLPEPATTWALVTKYPGASGQDDPASAPPPQPDAITLTVTLVASRMPAVSTSGGIATGACGMSRMVEKGFGKSPGRNRLPMVARNPGGRGMKRSSERSIVELLIWLSRPIHGLWENMSPRYQVAARAATSPSAAPTAESALPRSIVCCVRCRIAKPDRRADAFDEQGRGDEDADRKQTLRVAVLGYRFGDQRGDHRAEEEPGDEPRDCERHAAQASPQPREGNDDEEHDDDDVEDVHCRESLLARGVLGSSRYVCSVWTMRPICLTWARSWRARRSA